MVMEDKRGICEAFCRALQRTREFEDLEELEYEKYERGLETVVVRFKSGYAWRVNVTMDSGITMIKDIMKSIC